MNLAYFFLTLLFFLDVHSKAFLVKDYKKSDISITFEDCDKSGDSYLDVIEFRECLYQLANQQYIINDGTMDLIDNDKDKRISYLEFTSLIQKIIKANSQFVELVDKDGKRRYVNSQEIFDYPNDNLMFENGKLYQKNTGTASLQEINSKESSHLSSYISMTNWIHNTLKKSGYGLGKLENVKTLSGHEYQVLPNGDFETRLQLTIVNDSLISVFEVHIKRNKIEYVKPHFGLIEVYQIKENEKIKLPIDPTRLRMEGWSAYAKVLMYLASFFIALGFLLTKTFN